MQKLVKKTLTVAFAMGVSLSVSAKEKLTLLLDWFVNPDHAAIIVAQQKGYFAQQGLDVEIVEPADPSLPPKLVAAGKADLAVDYQPQLQIQVAEDLPLTRVGTLVATPLNSLIVLEKSAIKSLADLKGKKIGYSVSGFEDSLLKAMLGSANLTDKDIEMVNVNWSLSPSLISGQVDAVIGGFRNFELNQMKLEKQPGRAFYPEEHGVPVYDELILVANKNTMPTEKISKFLTALEQATIYTLNHPQAAWETFVAYKEKELNNDLNRLAWTDTLPRLALRPRALDSHRYERMAEFLKANGLTKVVKPLSDYAIEIK
ncbi:ABC transporter substrate-binding protein [Pasteurella multocida]|uniref:SsuA/THI5-like domain-containing protein n=1 Tax=Pasteurella multocida (strain Pm70) TaxID=272843 RepID=Q9CLH1_PASMU|nr:ABC transporter substrate-binding protein [Pasteurella multocida]AAK03347.1 unknown [Pasteurella multocida subsp. multocida str. Pm70]APW56400.1 thiamine biosynthesis protein [Pasteurella multocida subsp. multocida str. HN07]ARA69881.1 thiamine biosynthesis protein [Pasteurella multocida subsp. multocida]ARA90099.1 thiamine biosynthesis protein [Pasteurella multocida subsp. septica]AUL53822.1 thiamine biosynthesis protein [Pasteurella multocida]